MPRLAWLRRFPPLSSLLFPLSAGAPHARLPTPPQAQQDLLVLTMPAPQGSRAAEFHTLAQASQRTLRACPRNASRPQPQSLALTGSRGGERAKREIQLSSRKKWRCRTQTGRLILARQRKRLLRRTLVAQEAFKSCWVCDITAPDIVR